MEASLKTTLDTIHKSALRIFRHKDDQGEEWTMPPDDFDGSQPITDDCDGFCLAVRKLLRDHGIASRLVYCEIEQAGHLVVEVKGWILDNRQPVVISNTVLRAMQYQFKRISGFSPGDPWREIID